MVENYLKVEYPDGINKTYVRMLCEYLIKRFELKGYLLDAGAGTGDYYLTFEELGLETTMTTSDLEQKWFWIDDNTFDCVFSKSVLEHIQNTALFLTETERVLKPNGFALFLVPDWNAQWKYFYDDSTHIKPFTKKGLEQAFKLAGFKNVKCEYFFQLPFTWRHKWLRWIPYIVRLLPDNVKYWAKVIRFSKERMLLLTAVKSSMV